MNCTACGDPLPSLLSTYGPNGDPLCATCWFKGRTPGDDPIAVELESLTLQSIADTVYEPPIDGLLPPVDMLPCGWAGAQRVDPDGTMTADASVEAIKYL